MSEVQEAFDNHRQAQKIREAIAYLKAMTMPADDSMAVWADEEVMDAAGKYADYLESRAYHDEVQEPPQ